MPANINNPILDAARLTTRALEELQQDNATMRVQVAALETRLDEYKQINQSLFEQANKASIERDYFMRECAILSTRLSDLSALAQTALDEHRHAPYRRNGGAPEDVQKAVSVANEQKVVGNNVDKPVPVDLDKLAEDTAVKNEVERTTSTEKGDNGDPVPKFLTERPIVPVHAEETQIQQAEAHFGAPKNGKKNK